MASGTNAPLYTTSFLSTFPNEKEESDKHEGRLAEALELDRVTRVLEFRDPLNKPLQQVIPHMTRGVEIESKTVWNGTEWVLGGQDHSESILISEKPPY